MTDEESAKAARRSRKRIMEDGRSRLPEVEAEREGLHRVIGFTLGTSDRLALNKNEAADRLGVSVEFFERYIEPDLRFVRRGRRRIYPLGELLWWLWQASEGSANGRWADE